MVISNYVDNEVECDISVLGSRGSVLKIISTQIRERGGQGGGVSVGSSVSIGSRITKRKKVGNTFRPQNRD